MAAPVLRRCPLCQQPTELGQDGLPDLRLLRIQARLTQADLAVLTGKSEAAISRFESGERRPAPDTIVKLARALGVSSTRLNALLLDAPAEEAGSWPAIPEGG